ncbi:MAG: S-adenosylmethionine:tRNA ribosyltransferase-isomerase (EC [uncultured Campylobacterales bacterium]|uniref:S-adenosylmethionine:tRNA ribosyltransferase-isomerase n=1 Tax=uncultured Campylobacterales bacterium TaxID=352960 RepID=A0A6S6SRZ6_9BACT|nr:MAG: S-adenosylmethionine:tRNA ribosyltransferase-isomerase (EC [uncultured Campylobacterales bacterium]
MIELLQSYDYKLDESLIATHPASPKDSAKLMIYDRDKDTITHTTFSEILNFIPEGTKVFLNDTKVIKARLYGKKQSGGKVEVLLNSLSNTLRFSVYIKGRVKVGTKIFFDENLECEVLELREDGQRIVEFVKETKKLDFYELNQILERIAHIPLPPYIKRADETQDEEDYQTLFAKNIGAVAAPTASLHFTDELLEKFVKKYDTNYLTLHVGAGTFKSVDKDNIKDYQIHKEIFDVPKKSQKIIDSDAKILAIGTTVARTIEYYHKTGISKGEADIFLHPMNLPKRVDFLITNFHLPRTTLLMLVASFLTPSVGSKEGLDKALELYNIATDKKYKFFSYGDAMMIL